MATNTTLAFMLDAALAQVNAMRAEATEYETAIKRFGGVLGNLEKQLAQMEEALSKARLDHGVELREINARLVGLTAEFDYITQLRENLPTPTPTPTT